MEWDCEKHLSACAGLRSGVSDGLSRIYYSFCNLGRGGGEMKSVECYFSSNIYKALFVHQSSKAIA